MRKTMMAVFGLLSFGAYAQQDSLKTTTLQEVVVTGTKFEVPVEKSGKSIYKISSEDLSRSAGRPLSDLLNNVPGLHIDGNFGTPGSNLSYYVRGGRNKQTLVLIDGVPLNDPSAINAEYDLRYVPLSQIESVEILKGGLSTLYGTNAAAGVINIKLKDPSEKFAGNVEATAGSFSTFSQNLNVNGGTGKISFFGAFNNTTSKGFSSATDNDPAVVFDKDGFRRQNGLLKIGYKLTSKFSLGLQTAYEQFEADYDAFEFTDADSYQKYNQVRVGLTPNYTYGNGSLQAKFFYNVNERKFVSEFPSEYTGNNFQGEVIHRHELSKYVQTLVGLNYQNMAFDQLKTVDSDSAHFTIIDPYASLLIDLQNGLNIHAGLRLNTHSVYGSKLVYNINPSLILNRNGNFRYKVFGSISTSYITPSLYQLFSPYGNLSLEPEEAMNYEGGVTFLHHKFSLTATYFSRDESNMIDFVSVFDSDGNYVRGEYRNLTAQRNVSGVELSGNVSLMNNLSIGANYTNIRTDLPTSFYRIPKVKYGANIDYNPTNRLYFAVRYNFTGGRTMIDFSQFKEVTLKEYKLVDLSAAYDVIKDRLRIFGNVNNVFDESYVAVLGYTTVGRNFNAGAKFSF